MFSHQDRLATGQFVVLETALTTLLHVTPGHFLWSTKLCQGTDTQLVRAADINIGDCLWISEFANTSTPTLQQIKVTRAKLTKAQGLYNPHTASGSILVNRVATTTFTDTLPASMTIHAIVTIPARIIYGMMPKALSGWLNNKLLEIYFAIRKSDHGMLIMPFLSTKW